jgi:hypothetical protein
MTTVEKKVLNNELFAAGQKVLDNSSMFTAESVQNLINSIIELQKQLS